MSRKPTHAVLVRGTGSVVTLSLERMALKDVKIVAKMINDHVDPATGWSEISLAALAKEADHVKHWAGAIFTSYARSKPPFFEMQRITGNGHPGWGDRVRVRFTKDGVRAFAALGVHAYLAPAAEAKDTLDKVGAFVREVKNLPGVTVGSGTTDSIATIDSVEGRLDQLERTVDAIAAAVLDQPSLLERFATELEDCITRPSLGDNHGCDHGDDLRELEALREWRRQFLSQDPVLREVARPE